VSGSVDDVSLQWSLTAISALCLELHVTVTVNFIASEETLATRH